MHTARVFVQSIPGILRRTENTALQIKPALFIESGGCERMNDIPIAALRTFRALARRGSFTATASEMGLAQSAVSRLSVGTLPHSKHTCSRPWCCVVTVRCSSHTLVSCTLRRCNGCLMNWTRPPCVSPARERGHWSRSLRCHRSPHAGWFRASGICRLRVLTSRLRWRPRSGTRTFTKSGSTSLSITATGPGLAPDCSCTTAWFRWFRRGCWWVQCRVGLKTSRDGAGCMIPCAAASGPNGLQRLMPKVSAVIGT